MWFRQRDPFRCILLGSFYFRVALVGNTIPVHIFLGNFCHTKNEEVQGLGLETIKFCNSSVYNIISICTNVVLAERPLQMYFLLGSFISELL